MDAGCWPGRLQTALAPGEKETLLQYKKVLQSFQTELLLQELLTLNSDVVLRDAFEVVPALLLGGVEGEAEAVGGRELRAYAVLHAAEARLAADARGVAEETKIECYR